MEDSRLKSFFMRKKDTVSGKGFFKSEKWIILSLCTVLFSVIAFGIYASQSIALTVDLNGEVQEVETDADNVQELLAELNVDYKTRDDLSHRLNANLEPGMTLTWEKAFQVVMNHYGSAEKVWTTASTVEELLHDERLTLAEGDVVTPDPEVELEPDVQVEVAHYETKIVEDEYKVNYKTVRKDDPTILEGEERVLTSGTKGKSVHRYEVTYKNGKEIDREMIEREEIQEREDRLIAVGTKEPEPQPQPEQDSESRVQIASAESETQSSGGSADEGSTESKSKSSSESESSSSGGGKVIQVQSTAYTANCSGCSGVTSTGINLNANPNKKVIAVDPSVIPLGSTVEVEGYGRAVAGDTGGNIQGKRIDVHVPSKDAAYAWGQRTVTVRILE